jgi:3-hydroxyisobutyrate dehydrogenase
MTEPRMGFIGLGNIGGRVTRHLVTTGHDVLGFDIRAERIQACGARPAASVAAVTEGSDVVLLSLPDSKAIESIMLGPDGVLASARDGQVVVDLSTAAPVSTRKIHESLARRNLSYLDAGISGGAAAAEKGALVLMVGGEPEALERVRDVLQLFSAHIFHCGPSGAGHVTKLLNNFLNAVSLAATAEVMVAARKAGLDLKMVLDVINLSSGVNYATQHRFPRIIEGDYLTGGLTNTLMLKDVTLYTEYLAQLGVASMNSAGPIASFGMARALGYANMISNTVVDAIGDISGRVRLYEGLGATGVNSGPGTAGT